MASRTQSHVLTDHEEIRRWAEERAARPACVRGTGGDGDIGMLRLDFPGYTGETSLEEISWDDWLQKFEERNLALLVQDTLASGERSNFNKIIGRETAQARAQGQRRAKRRTVATARPGARSTRTTSARGRSTASARGRSRATTSKRGAASRGKRATGSRRAVARKKTTRRVTSHSKSRRKAA